MKFLLLLIIILSSMTKAQDNFPNDLYSQYDRFKEPGISKKRFTHAELMPLIDKLRSAEMYNVVLAGKSFEGRNIFYVKTGHGKIKVLLWSQMHGDESTATMALLDIFNFLKSDDEFNSVKNHILNELTLYFVPMLNPDGAERFQRRTAQEIDMNRDALMLQTPEANILKNLRDSLNADFGFNLHDQSTRYSAGMSFKNAALSFLAPAYNYEKEINPSREKSVKLIAFMNDVLAKFIPGHIAKYSDEFEPRAFGDNIQKWGTSTILIESGGWKDDPEKQFLRKLNFIAILSALKSIADNSYYNKSIDDYFAIPDNGKYIFDLILRNVSIKIDNKSYNMDLGINRYEEIENGVTYVKGLLEDAGDLSVFYGYDEIDCSGMDYSKGKTLLNINDSDLSSLNYEELYKQGYTSAILNNSSIHNNYTYFPFIIKSDKPGNSVVDLMKPATFLLKEEGNIRYVIINGFIYDVKTSTNKILNGIIEK